jgi:hypothetical protein
MTPTLPLSALLSQVLVSLSLEFERAGAGRHPMPGLEVWSNLLRCVGPHRVVERDLPVLTRLSKRAVRARVGNAIRQGWLRVEDGKLGRVTALLGLTEQGRNVRESWPALEAEAIDAWDARIGEDHATTLRAALRTLVGQLELEHPHFPASYGAADWSITGHDGQDWRPVRRGDGDTVGALPVQALLSQPLVALSREYEADGWCLAYDANVLRFLSAEGRPSSILPALLTDGLSTLERHRYLETGRDGTIRLLARGQEAHDQYESRLAAIEARWERTHAIGPLREVLEDIVRTLGLDLPHHPIGVVDTRTGLVLQKG